MAFYRGGDAGHLGFTHAHFPVHAFAETDIREHWAFARHDTGWLGLYAANGLEQITKWTRCRPGTSFSGCVDNTWLCLMGGEAIGRGLRCFSWSVSTSTLAVASRCSLDRRTRKVKRCPVDWR